MTNFKECINLSEDIVTTLDGKELILKGLHNYYGPLTMQLLPFGGIQGVNGGNLIIHVKNGYICPREIVYSTGADSTWLWKCREFTCSEEGIC